MLEEGSHSPRETKTVPRGEKYLLGGDSWCRATGCRRMWDRARHAPSVRRREEVLLLVPRPPIAVTGSYNGGALSSTKCKAASFACLGRPAYLHACL